MSLNVPPIASPSSLFQPKKAKVQKEDEKNESSLTTCFDALNGVYRYAVYTFLTMKEKAEMMNPNMRNTCIA